MKEKKRKNGKGKQSTRGLCTFLIFPLSLLSVHVGVYAKWAQETTEDRGYLAWVLKAPSGIGHKGQSDSARKRWVSFLVWSRPEEKFVCGLILSSYVKEPGNASLAEIEYAFHGTKVSGRLSYKPAQFSFKKSKEESRTRLFAAASFPLHLSHDTIAVFLSLALLLRLPASSRFFRPRLPRDFRFTSVRF